MIGTGTEAEVATMARKQVACGQHLAAARALAVCRYSEPVASAVMSCRWRTADCLHAALLAYGLGSRARSVIDVVAITRKAAEGDPDGRLALALLLSDSSILPDAPSPQFQSEMDAVQEVRQRLLRRNDSPSQPSDTGEKDIPMEQVSSASESEKDAETVCVEGVSLPKRMSSPCSTTQFTLVYNEKSKQAVHDFAAAMASGVPVLLEGPPGSGKTALVNYLAETTGNATTNSATEGNR